MFRVPRLAWHGRLPVSLLVAVLGTSGRSGLRARADVVVPLLGQTPSEVCR